MLDAGAFSEGPLLLSLVVSSVGLVLFLYGRKQHRWPHLVVGLALMVYPYFVSSLRSMLAFGLVLIAALWLAVRQGW
jgi:hypothetical protein